MRWKRRSRSTRRRFMGELPEQRESNIKILEQLQNQFQRVGENLRAAQDRKLFLQKQMTEMELPIGSPGAGSAESEDGRRPGSTSAPAEEMASSPSGTIRSGAGSRGTTNPSRKRWSGHSNN